LSEANELEVLFPGEDFPTSLGTVRVSPFKFKHFKDVLVIAKKYLTLFGVVAGDDPEEKKRNDFAYLLLEHGEGTLDDVTMLVSYSTGLERKDIDELSGDAAISLFFKVFEVNADFFVRKIVEGSNLVARRLVPAGVSLSPDSSATDTGG
jgi:hypothetical protein